MPFHGVSSAPVTATAISEKSSSVSAISVW